MIQSISGIRNLNRGQLAAPLRGLIKGERACNVKATGALNLGAEAQQTSALAARGSHIEGNRKYIVSSRYGRVLCLCGAGGEGQRLTRSHKAIPDSLQTEKIKALRCDVYFLARSGRTTPESPRALRSKSQPSAADRL